MPWVSAVPYLGLVLDSQVLYTTHLHTVVNRATAVLCNILPLNVHTVQPVDPLQTTHSIHSNLRRPCLQFHHVPPTTPLKLPAIQSKCLPVNSNYPRRASASHLHDFLNFQPIPVTIHRMFCSLPLPPQPPGPTDQQLYSSRTDCCVPEIQT